MEITKSDIKQKEKEREANSVTYSPLYQKIIFFEMFLATKKHKS